MTTEEFSQRPFAVGTLTGLRAFEVDELGRLTGPRRGGVFTPGENKASCYRAPIDRIVEMTHQLTFRRDLARAAGLAHLGSAAEVEMQRVQQHHVGMIGCTCGFYAYTDGTNDSHRADNTVAAIVEGYGVCTVGSRGFRSSKARLVALVRPARESFFASRAWIAAMVALNTWAFVNDSATDPWWSTALSGGLAALLFAWLVWLTIKGRPWMPASRLDGWDLVRRNYPDVPVYRSTRAALRAHPLSTPPEPPAPTPDDEDFWTREVGA